LANPLLGAVARRIGQNWQARYGHGLDWLESFVDRERCRGSCDRAANGQCVGQTRGRSRQERDRELQVPVKGVSLNELRRRAHLAYTATVVSSHEKAEAMATKWRTPMSDGCVF
jgi:Domain of unknown function (DUF4338)